MKLEIGKKYTDGCTVLEVKFFDYQGTAWCLSNRNCCKYIYKDESHWREVVDKPDPGEGWRLLEPDEDLEEGDEIFLPDAHPYDDWNCIQTRNNKQTSGLYYRRRITPQYIPYTWDDRDELRGRWYRRKDDKHYERQVTLCNGDKNNIFINGWIAKEFLDLCEWLDGTPCGKVVV